MYSKKHCYLFLTTLFFSLAFIDSSTAQCSTCTTTYTVPNGSTVYLSASAASGGIPISGNGYCLEVNGILRIDDSWNANNVCIKLSHAGRIIIESGNHYCNLTNATVKPLYNNVIEPFKIDSGSTLVVAYSTVEDTNIGFRGQGDIWLYDVDLDGWGQQGVGVMGPSSGNVTIDDCTFTNFLSGMILQGVNGSLNVNNSTFSFIDFHGMSATAVSGLVSIVGNDFDNIETAMAFGTSSSQHSIYNNTTTNVITGLYSHTLGDTYVNGNNFSFTGKGADMRYVENLNMSGNTFSSTQISPLSISRIGLHVVGSFGKIHSNVFEGMDVGAFFREYNGFDNNFRSNQFVGDQTHGLYLATGSRIGYQCHQHNKWLGTYSQDAAYSPDWNIKYNSKFRVTSTPGEMPPSHYPTGWFKISSTPCISVSDPNNPSLPGNPEEPGFSENESIFSRGLGTPEYVKVFPNPASNNLNISLPSFSKNVKVELRDITGKIIRTTKIKDDLSTYELDISDMNSGIYIIGIQSDKYRFAEKLIISR